MCYPAGVSSISGHESEIRIRRLAALATAVNHREAGGGGGVKKQCLCSPTIHPGSFRCRHHHSEYVWFVRPHSKSAANSTYVTFTKLTTIPLAIDGHSTPKPPDTGAVFTHDLTIHLNSHVSFSFSLGLTWLHSSSTPAGGVAAVVTTVCHITCDLHHAGRMVQAQLDKF
ncbi:unnamed protein product [Lactuca saligna]|uniref:Uncharacterized protein n=1 Tax=Lactuca saligna TaxID=75948 RepID=A0AA36E3U6_LACSI|nr:unnamed protein product [Lactuca saligna]